MEIDPLVDELFLRLVLERQPHAAKPGKKRTIWFEIARVVNESSGRVVFRAAQTAIQRLKFLSLVRGNPKHALHNALTREMREMLGQILEADAKGTARPTASSRVRTRSQSHDAPDTTKTNSAPAPKKKRAAVSQRAVDPDVAALPVGSIPAVTPSLEALDGSLPTALVPYAPPTHETTLAQYLGAQAERDRQACYEREQLRRELMDCKRESAAMERELALLQRGRQPAVATTAPEPVADSAVATTAIVHLLEELSAEQRLAREESQRERVSHREQMAAMVAMVRHVVDGAKPNGAFGQAAADSSSI